jgi:hypothetical protein
MKRRRRSVRKRNRQRIAAHARRGEVRGARIQVRAPLSSKSAPIHASRFSGNGINGQAN